VGIVVGGGENSVKKGPGTPIDAAEDVDKNA
jgi:hypothetical protein